MRVRAQQNKPKGIVHVQVTVEQHWMKPSTRRVKLVERKGSHDKQIADQADIEELRRANKRRGAAQG